MRSSCPVCEYSATYVPNTPVALSFRRRLRLPPRGQCRPAQAMRDQCAGRSLDDHVTRAVEIFLRCRLQPRRLSARTESSYFRMSAGSRPVDIVAGEKAQPVTILTQTRFTLAQIGLADLLQVLVRHAVHLHTVDLGEYRLLQLRGTLGCRPEIDPKCVAFSRKVRGARRSTPTPYVPPRSWRSRSRSLISSRSESASRSLHVLPGVVERPGEHDRRLRLGLDPALHLARRSRRSDTSCRRPSTSRRHASPADSRCIARRAA